MQPGISSKCVCRTVSGLPDKRTLYLSTFTGIDFKAEPPKLFFYNFIIVQISKINDCKINPSSGFRSYL